MNKENIHLIFLFIGLLLLQVVVLNNINLFGYLNPFLYILFIFYYPIKKINAPLLFFSFFLGLSIDFFSNSGGINAAATVFIAFIRIPVLKSILGKREIMDENFISLQKMPFPKAVTYIVILTFIHHFIIFGLEYFKWDNFVTILYKTLFTSAFTLFFIAISFIFIKKK